ncbi:hypothetical protein PPL_08305 [Heterostelium album PN500]|uniref:Uncharacterized protein n=1 Tax=Heterostelium pallidum (strain ATCC 26659 / Pp 5 / PN500) TaxID=670386 RepID=D3BHU0_HETP5|nr:hypothetical protein PPL_08305 [Heterostelium album PN500]EFA78840.1 hypothetical protein PPL_08305 [Heterostelium album PN500]|eukprot:XP_020430964.1 hypothetical protein PPL_08305 [Heterostelium album PN500]
MLIDVLFSLWLLVVYEQREIGERETMEDHMIQNNNNNGDSGGGGVGASVNDGIGTTTSTTSPKINNNNNNNNNSGNDQVFGDSTTTATATSKDDPTNIRFGSSQKTFTSLFGQIPMPHNIAIQQIPSQVASLPLADSNRYNKNGNNNEDDHSNNNGDDHHKHHHRSSRFTPYRATPHLDYQDRLELVEQIVSMFPLLEKDGKVYSILERNSWSVEKSIPELQKRHDQQELIAKQAKALVPNNLDGSGGNNNNGGGGDTMNDSQEMSEGRSISLSDSMSYEDEDEELLGEEEEEPVDDNQLFPKLKEDIQTLKDIFGNTYQEFELKGYYMMCNGNLELVIDQLVNEQNQINKLKEEKPSVQLPPRQPLTSRLSEAEKRALQLQLIEEQEKLEKNFETKKKEKESSHPNKKTYSQQDILKELKELFGKTVEEGVIDWVAYSCDYNLGNCVTQLIDLKNNALMKKGQAAAAAAGFKPQLDPAVQMKLQSGVAELLGGMAPKAEAQMTDDTTTPTILTSQVSFESFLTDVQSKLTVPHSETSTTTTNNNNNNNNTKTSPTSLWETSQTNIKLEKTDDK